MSREILFRGMELVDGKRTGKFVYGGYWKGPKGQVWILLEKDETAIEVDPSTVGQFTGFEDVNDKKAFAGDKVGMNWTVDMSPGPVLECEAEAVIVWEDGGFVFHSSDPDVHQWPLTVPEEFEIIGNVHNQPADKEE